MSNADDVWATPPEGTPPPQPPNSPYGAPAYGPAGGYAPIAPKHPQATTAMVLGIIGLVGGFLTGIAFVVAPFAWVIGGKAVREIDASPESYSGRDQAKAGQILGIIGTILLVLTILVVGLVIAAFVVYYSA